MKRLAENKRKQANEQVLYNSGTDSDDSSVPIPPILLRRRANIQAHKKAFLEMGYKVDDGTFPSEDVAEIMTGRKSTKSNYTKKTGTADDSSDNNNDSDDLDDHNDSDGDDQTEDSGDDVMGEEVIEIIKKRHVGRFVELCVKWDKGNVTWNQMKHVRQDYPDLVREFNTNHSLGQNASVVSSTGSVNTARSKKCTSKHSTITDFKAEEDGKYWDDGNAFENNRCGTCRKKSRPISIKRPSYVCVEWASHGCLETRCNLCYIGMVKESW